MNNKVQFVGIVACVPKGDWQSNLTYDLLNIVRHNNASWVATTTVPANNEPSLNSKYWNLLVKDGENGSGSSITIDDFLSLTSTNPVQNKVIALALKDKQALLVSGVNIKTINNQSILGEGDLEIDKITVDKELSNTSTNPVENQAVTKALDEKLDKNTNISGNIRLYAQTGNGQETTYVVGSTAAASYIDRIPKYFLVTDNQNNREVVGALLTTTPQFPYQCANKQYVDNVIANASSTKLYQHDIFVNVQNITYFRFRITTTSATEITYDIGLQIEGEIVGNVYYGSSGSVDNIYLQDIIFLRRASDTYYTGCYMFMGLTESSTIYYSAFADFFPSEITEFTDTVTEL